MATTDKKKKKSKSPHGEKKAPEDFHKRMPRVGDCYCRVADYPNPEEWWMIISTPEPSTKARSLWADVNEAWWCCNILHYPSKKVLDGWPFRTDGLRAHSDLVLMAEAEE